MPFNIKAINLSDLICKAAPIEAISLRARKEGIRVDTVLHDDAAHFESMSWIASQSELCLVFVSLFLVEAWDRSVLRLDHEGEEMIKTVEKSCAGEVVMVMHVGGQVLVEDWVRTPFPYKRQALTASSSSCCRSTCQRSAVSSLPGTQDKRLETQSSISYGAT